MPRTKSIFVLCYSLLYNNYLKLKLIFKNTFDCSLQEKSISSLVRLIAICCLVQHGAQKTMTRPKYIINFDYDYKYRVS